MKLTRDYSRIACNVAGHDVEGCDIAGSEVESEKKKKKKNNPYAICTESVGREDEAKYKRCKEDVERQNR